MSELNETRWSVLSERGCEAAHLPYAAAAQLVAQLKSEPVFGLCIITDEAAARLNGTPNVTKQKTTKRRAPRRKKSKQ